MKRKVMGLGLVLLMVLGIFNNNVNATSHSYGTWEYNNKTIHYIKTTPSKIAFLQNSGNISNCTYDHCINGPFYGNYDDGRRKIASIAVSNDKPVYQDHEDYKGKDWCGDLNDVGSGVKHALVYDRKDGSLEIQQVASYKDIDVTEKAKSWAIGGIKWGLTSDVPRESSSTGRTAMVYDKDNNLYCIVVSADVGMTADEFTKAIKENLTVAGGVYLDGSTCSQMKYNGEEVVAHRRTVYVAVGIQN